MSIDLTRTNTHMIAIVTLNRPEALDAMTAEALREVGDAFQRADRNGARVIVRRGKRRSVCAGADRTRYPGFKSGEPDFGAARRAIEIGIQLKRATMNVNALTVARAHGHVVGGGLVMTMCCDMRFAADDAKMALPRLALPLGPLRRPNVQEKFAGQ